MQKIGSCGGEGFAPATLLNQEKPVEEEDKYCKIRSICKRQEKFDNYQCEYVSHGARKKNIITTLHPHPLRVSSVSIHTYVGVHSFVFFVLFLLLSFSQLLTNINSAKPGYLLAL